MIPGLVLDCSVAMAWFFENEVTHATDGILDRLADGEPSVVPAHFALEVSNTLVNAERAHRSTPAEAALFLDVLDGLGITVDPATADQAGGATLALARTHRLSTYDAAYLELALRRHTPLATLDKDLRAAAKRAGVPVLPARL